MSNKRFIIQHAKFYVHAGKFRGYLFTGDARQKHAKRNGIGAENPGGMGMGMWKNFLRPTPSPILPLAYRSPPR